jgi:hypothetical protein
MICHLDYHLEKGVMLQVGQNRGLGQPTLAACRQPAVPGPCSKKCAAMTEVSQFTSAWQDQSVRLIKMRPGKSKVTEPPVTGTLSG